MADLVEVGFSEVAVRESFGEHVIGADEDLVGAPVPAATRAPAGRAAAPERARSTSHDASTGLSPR